MASFMLETTKTDDFLTISIPIKNMKAEEIEHFLSLIKSEFLVRKSKLTQEQADKISEEIKSSWWQKNKSIIERMVAENE